MEPLYSFVKQIRKDFVTALLTRLDRKRRDRWSEAVQSIDFSQSSHKAWSILNNFASRLQHSSRHCSESADAISFQLVRYWRYEDFNRASSRLISQEVSDFWRATTSSRENISKILHQEIHCRPSTPEAR